MSTTSKGMNELEEKTEREGEKTLKPASKKLSGEGVKRTINVMGKDWGWHEVMMHCLLEALEGRMGKKCPLEGNSIDA